MKFVQHSLGAPFLGIRDASRVTGLSQHYLREGCKSGGVPHIKSGNVYLINVPMLLKQLDRQSCEATVDG